MANGSYADDPQYGGGGRYQSADYPRASKGTSRQSQKRSNRDLVSVLPTSQGEKASGAVGALTAEFLGGIALLFLTLFTDTSSSYSDKMLAIMKRGTLLGLSFFLLALISGQGPNAARVAKAFGLLLDVGLILSVSSDTMLKELDGFITGAWKPSGNSSDAGSAGAQAGSGALGPNAAPTVPGTSAASKASDFLLWLRQQPINTAKGIVKDIEGLIP